MDLENLELRTEVQKVRLEIARAWQLNEQVVGWREGGSMDLALQSEALNSKVLLQVSRVRE